MFKGKAAGNTAVFSISPELFRISCPHRTADIPQIQFYVKNVKTRKPLNIKGLAGSVFRIFPKYYSNSTITNQFCLEIILCRVYSSFDYLIYPYYPAYTG